MLGDIGQVRRFLTSSGSRMVGAALDEALDIAREVVADVLGRGDDDKSAGDVIAYRQAEDAVAKVAAAVVDEAATDAAEHAVKTLAGRVGHGGLHVAERLAQSALGPLVGTAADALGGDDEGEGDKKPAKAKRPAKDEAGDDGD